MLPLRAGVRVQPSMCGKTIVFEEGIAVGAVSEGNVEDLCVLEGLLHAIAYSMLVVLGLHDGQRDIRLVEEE